MEKYLTELFNNGSNTGDIKIVTSDGTINCHSFVLEKSCQYCVSWFHFDGNKNSAENMKKEIKFDYPTEIITIGLNRLYSSSYQFPEFDPHKIISLFSFYNELQIFEWNSVKKDLVTIFEKQITTENWLELLETIIDFDIYTELKDCVCHFFMGKIIQNINSLDEITFQNVACKKLLTDLVFKDYKIVKVKSNKLFNFELLEKSLELFENECEDDCSIFYDPKIRELFDLSSLNSIDNLDSKENKDLLAKTNKLYNVYYSIMGRIFYFLSDFPTKLVKQNKSSKMGTDLDRPKSQYQLFISQEIKKQRAQNPGLKNNEYMKLAAIQWNRYKEENIISHMKGKAATKQAEESSGSDND